MGLYRFFIGYTAIILLPFLFVILLPFLSFGQITNISTNGNTGSSVSVITCTISCTGANFIGVGVVYYPAPLPTSVTDNQGNTYTRQVRTSYTSYQGGDIWFTYGNSLSSSITVSVTFASSSTVGTVGVASFSNVKTSASPADQFNSYNSNTTNESSIQPGSITPSVSNCLILSEATFSSYAPTVAPPTGYTTIYRTTGLSYPSIQFVYKISSVAENPTYTTVSGSNTSCALIADFLPGPPTVTGKGFFKKHH